MTDDQRKVLQDLWVENKMLFDKSLLQLSTFGVGFTVTLASILSETLWGKLLLFLAGICFAASCTTCLKIFASNAKYMGELLAGTTSPFKELTYSDAIARLGFLLGVGLTILAPAADAINL